MKAARRWQWIWAGWALVALLMAMWVIDLADVWRISNHKDLAVFLDAGNRLLVGGDIYADVPRFQSLVESGQFSMQDDTVVWPYAYAPLIAMMFAPLSKLPLTWVEAGWWLFNVFGLVGMVALAAAAMRIEITPLRAGVLLWLIYRFHPATVALRLGQIEIAEGLLMGLSLYASSRRRDTLAGISLGLATAVKFFPGALITLFLWRRRWRAAAWAIGVAVVCVVGSFALVGFDRVAAYTDFGNLYGIGGPFASFPLNQSINGLMSRNLILNPFTATLRGWNLPWLAKALTLVADAIVVAISATVTFHRFPWSEEVADDGDVVDHRRFCLEYGLAIVAVLLVSPHSQLYAYVWALIPLTVAALWWLDADAPQRVALFVTLAIAYFLVGRSYQLYVPGLTRIVQAHPLCGATLLWGILAMILAGMVQQDHGRLWLE